MSTGGRIVADRIGQARVPAVLAPDEAARAALAVRLRVPAIEALTCRFELRRDRRDAILADGTLDAVVVQEDVTTLELFACPVHEAFMLRFVPEAALGEMLDPDDPVDEVGYEGGRIDLEEAMCQQLALALDPYPRQGQAPSGHA